MELLVALLLGIPALLWGLRHGRTPEPDAAAVAGADGDPEPDPERDSAAGPELD